MLGQAESLAQQERQLAARLAAIVAQQDSYEEEEDDDDFSVGDRPFSAATLVEAAVLLEPRKRALSSRAAREPPLASATGSRLERAWLGALRAEIAAVDAVGPEIEALWPPPEGALSGPTAVASTGPDLVHWRVDDLERSLDEAFDDDVAALASTRALRRGILGGGDGDCGVFEGACLVVDVVGVDALRDDTIDRFKASRNEGGLPEWDAACLWPTTPSRASEGRRRALNAALGRGGDGPAAAVATRRAAALSLAAAGPARAGALGDDGGDGGRASLSREATLEARWRALDDIYGCVFDACRSAGGDVVRATTSGALVAVFHDDKGADAACAAAALAALAVGASEGDSAKAAARAGLPAPRCAVAAGPMRVLDVKLAPDEIRCVPVRVAHG